MVKGWVKQRHYDFEHTREICYTIAAVNREAGKSFPKKQDMWPLLTDEKIEVDDLTSIRDRIMAQYKQQFPTKFEA